MPHWSFLLASLISLASAIFHGYVGGNVYMANINAADLEPLTRSLSLVSWHIFTIFLIVSAVAIFYVGYVGQNADRHRPYRFALYPLIAINVMGALLFMGLGAAGHAALLQMPGAYLMGGVAILTWIGVRRTPGA